MQKAKKKQKNQAPIGTIVLAGALVLVIFISMFIPKPKEQYRAVYIDSFDTATQIIGWDESEEEFHRKADVLNEKLIYMKHCPIKEHLGGDCSRCKYTTGITLSLAGRKFNLKRKKLASCLFYLEDQEKYSFASEGFGRVMQVV